jgi:hypothetical protein
MARDRGVRIRKRDDDSGKAGCFAVRDYDESFVVCSTTCSKNHIAHPEYNEQPRECPNYLVESKLSALRTAHVGIVEYYGTRIQERRYG